MPKHFAAALMCALAITAAVALPDAATPQAATIPSAGTPAPAASATYVGSTECRRCHPAVYDRWTKTLMANVVRDPRDHPDAIIPDLSKADPLVAFKKDDIALVYGSKWKQRYFTKVGTDYFPLGAQWDVANRVWRAYMVQPNTDWWVPQYPADNMKRPTGPLCDGCHSVNYNTKTNAVTEWNVGCEKCHGPASAHLAKPGRGTIVNPARIDPRQGTDVCVQCHSQGQPLTNPIDGRYYDWPVGFTVGHDLKDYWELEAPKPGETTFTHFGDGTSHKNRMQGNDFVDSLMYRRGVTCFSCHDPHGTGNAADLIKPAKQLCLTCHAPGSPNGPRGASIEAHTHHGHDSAGSDCIGCHMPKTSQTIANINVRSHTFRFVTPSTTDQFKVPNPCLGCHKDKDSTWARTTLRTWDSVSPWRVK